MSLLGEQSLWVVLLGLVTLTLFAVFTMGLFSGNQMPVDGKTVLLTGASEGMGLSVAQKLAAKGANVVIVSRDVAKLQDAVQAIKASARNPSTQRFHYISADVAADGYADSVIAEAVKWNDGKMLDIVWCIAGMSIPGLFLDADVASMRKHMDINFFGSAQMGHSIFKAWLAPDAPIEKQAKHLIFTSSVVALYTIPGYAVYAPTKWALRGLADTLSQEVLMYPQNVKVHIVYPGTILSPGYERELLIRPAFLTDLEESDPKQTPDEVAEKSIRGLENGEYNVTVSWLGELMRYGTLSGMFRNNWVIDTIGAWLVQIVWIFAQMDMHGKMKGYRKKYGHPSSWSSKSE
jgi:3-dehydrosphinganine reductase